ncbi:MAG TPA: hypothetical protein VFF48_05175, partial [Brevundimonas sp.]|nr:hypothetical protein [Brevundimonas sp.]
MTVRTLAFSLALFTAAVASSASTAQQITPAALTEAVQGLRRPSAIYVAGRGVPEPFGAAAGVAYPDTGEPITVDTPLRIASNA